MKTEDEEQGTPGNPEPIDFRFSTNESIYLQEGQSYCMCGVVIENVEATGFYNIVIVGKLLGSGIVQPERVIYEREEGQAQ